MSQRGEEEESHNFFFFFVWYNDGKREKVGRRHFFLVSWYMLSSPRLWPQCLITGGRALSALNSIRRLYYSSYNELPFQICARGLLLGDIVWGGGKKDFRDWLASKKWFKPRRKISRVVTKRKEKNPTVQMRSWNVDGPTSRNPFENGIEKPPRAPHIDSLLLLLFSGWRLRISKVLPKRAAALEREVALLNCQQFWVVESLSVKSSGIPYSIEKGEWTHYRGVRIYMVKRNIRSTTRRTFGIRLFPSFPSAI